MHRACWCTSEALGVAPRQVPHERYTRQNLAKPFFWPAAAAPPPRGDTSPKLIFFTLSSLGLAPAALQVVKTIVPRVSDRAARTERGQGLTNACCFEICLAIVSKASATLVPSSADASIKSALIDLAKSGMLPHHPPRLELVRTYAGEE